MLDHWLGEYILDKQGNPVPERDYLAWARWYEHANRSVAFTEFAWGAVSTVFLGLDHNFQSSAEEDPLGHKPVLWETMVFQNATDQERTEWESNGMPVRRWGGSRDCRRYASREDALVGHREIVEQCRTAAASEDDRIEIEQGTR